VRYTIYGAGAIGGVIGAKLVQHGHDVRLIARGEHLHAIQTSGLTFKTPLETCKLRIPVVGHPSELAFAADDVVLLTMKTQDAPAALLDLRAAAGTDVPVVCAQNGVENERLASRVFSRVYAMLVLLPTVHLEPGVVIANAAPISGVLDAGRYPSGVDAVIEQVTMALDGSGFSSRAVDDAVRWKYAKLLSNLGNAIQAACGPHPDAGRLYQMARAEAVECYQRAGIDWASEDEMRARRTSMSAPAPVDGTARAGGSMWQSLARGTGATESDYLNGEITLLGRSHGVATPVNAALQHLSAKMARERRPPGSVDPADIEVLIGQR
jgi:2-dehydropantoate 2-reductase